MNFIYIFILLRLFFQIISIYIDFLAVDSGKCLSVAFLFSLQSSSKRFDIKLSVKINAFTVSHQSSTLDVVKKMLKFVSRILFVSFTKNGMTRSFMIFFCPTPISIDKV